MEIANKFIIRCEECNAEMMIHGSNFDFEITDVDERGMGAEVLFESEQEYDCIHCDNTLNVNLKCWEYPVGALNFDESTISGGVFVIKPKYKIHEIDMDLAQISDLEEMIRPKYWITEMIRTKSIKISDLTPFEFEQLVKEVFENHGYEVFPTKKTRDGGYDMLMKLNVKGIPFICLVECKHHKAKIGIEVVRSMYGVHTSNKANKSIIVSTSKFTKDAKEFAKSTESLIHLVDGDDLLEMIRS